MFDFYVPEPAAIYKYLSTEQPVPEKPIKPQPPREKLVDINEDSYLRVLKSYGIATSELPPKERFSTQFAFATGVTETNNGENSILFKETFQSDIIPEGYVCEKASVNGYYVFDNPAFTHHHDSVSLIVNLHNEKIVHLVDVNENVLHTNEFIPKLSGQIKGESEFSPGITKSVNLAISGFSTVGCAISGDVIIHCKRTDDAYDQWKMSIFNLLMEDYQQRLQEWEDEQEPEDKSYIQIRGRNPFLNREIERDELKRHIIAALLCNYFNGIGSMRDGVSDGEVHEGYCKYPQIDFEHLERDTPIIRFFEQVFLWKNMNYLFYHSMWSRKCKWREMFEADSGDPLFDKFLTSGAARVQVPIRNGMEAIFKWFLDHKEIWIDSLPPVFGEPEYISILQELKESKQGDYNSRDGNIKLGNGTLDNQVLLSDSRYYWDEKNDEVNKLNLGNDINREILIDRELYRIVQVHQFNENDPLQWIITLDRDFEGGDSVYQHSVGALYVGAPWEVMIPTKLVYLQNEEDKLPTYPLNS